VKLSKRDIQFVRDSLRLVAEQKEQLEARLEDCTKRLATLDWSEQQLRKRLEENT
jgi:chaperonin cofactor prefoldin